MGCNASSPSWFRSGSDLDLRSPLVSLLVWLVADLEPGVSPLTLEDVLECYIEGILEVFEILSLTGLFYLDV